MALSGEFYGTTNNQYIQPKIVWSAVQSVDGNYSDVTATLYYSRTNTGYRTSGTWSGSVVIGATSTYGSEKITITENSNSQAITAITRIYHDADGSKSITISATGGITGTSFASTSISSNVTLDTIPRATTPVLSSSNFTMGDTITITLPRASSEFAHTLTYVFGSVSGTISAYATTSYTWTVPTEILAPVIPNASSGAGTIYCATYQGTALIGTKSVSFIANVPESVKPSAPAITATEATEGLATQFDSFVQNKSSLKILIDSTSQYGATISAYRVTVDGTSYSGNSFTSGIIKSSGAVAISATVTDTRGRSNSATISITVLPYFNPSISQMYAWRIDTSQQASDDGERLALMLKYAIAPVGNNNTKTYAIKYRKSTDTSYTLIESGTAQYAYDSVMYFTDAPVFSTDCAYVIRFELADYFMSTAYEVQLPTAETTFDVHSSGNGIAFGKVAENENLLESAWPMKTPELRATALDLNQAGTPGAGGGYIDFHWAGSTEDYTSRIFEDAQGQLDFQAPAGVAINGNMIADFVIEYGEETNWGWRKWNSGRSECWGFATFTNISISNAWGPMFYYDAQMPNFPDIFIDTPISTTSPISASAGLFFTSNTSVTSTSIITHIVSAVSTTATVTVEAHCTGNWKEIS